MADSECAEIGNDSGGVTKGETRMQLQAVSGRRNLIELIHSVGASFVGGNKNPI